MDRELLAWGLRGKPGPVPRLWLFTDERRMADPRVAVAALPRGRAGVVLRHDADPVRRVLARDVARICRARRLPLVVAGDVRLACAVRAGVHLRGGRWPCPPRSRRLLTSSAHTVQELRRAAAAGVAVAFLSPAFATASHDDSPGLGPLRWALLAGRLRSRSMVVAALGGVNGRSIRRLPAHLCGAAGAISALLS